MVFYQNLYSKLVSVDQSPRCVLKYDRRLSVDLLLPSGDTRSESSFVIRTLVRRAPQYKVKSRMRGGNLRSRREIMKERLITKIQAVARGYLVRKKVQKKEEILKIREEQKKNWAASKIQALFRGHKARVLAQDKRLTELRRRWREGSLESNQKSLKERNEEVIEVLNKWDIRHIETVIRAFRSLKLLTEVFPMMYNKNASPVVRQVYIYMSGTNRSKSSIEVLKSAAAVLVNLTRYEITGPKIYARDRMPPILKFMLRFSNSETHLFCILCSYIWLFSKYDNIRQDLKEFLHMPENLKLLNRIKDNVDRSKRMASNARSKFYNPQSHKFISHTNHSMNMNICSSNSSNNTLILPSLDPDYGIVRVDKPRYFEDPQQAINCLFQTFNL